MNRNNKWILAAIPLMSALATGSYAESFYKWTDEQGATHYTQTPPPKKVVKKITVSTHTPQDSSDAIKNLNDQSRKDLKATTVEEAAAAKTNETAAAEAERRNKNSEACQQLRDSQAQLQSGRRLRIEDASGERNYLTEDQKAQKLSDQSIQIKNNCP